MTEAPAGPRTAPDPVLAPGGPVARLRLDSPIGAILLTGDGRAVTRVVVGRSAEPDPDAGDAELDAAADALLEDAAWQLREYFAGARGRIDVPVAARGTAFQRAVWSRLAAIPFGGSRSYGELGLEVGGAPSGRAVGAAVAANPVPLLVPCHRVLAAGRRITGYTVGDGPATKRWLLDHEGVPHR